MAARFNLQPDPQFSHQRDRLRERVNSAAASLTAETFADLLDPLMQLTARDAFDAASAHEGTIWLADSDEKYLVPAFNTGARADQVIGVYKQPLTNGLISMVFKNGQTFCENGVYRNAQQDKALDESLDVLTCAMIAVPLSFALEVRGVISCVQLKPAGLDTPDPAGFPPSSIYRIERLAAVLGRLLDYSLVGTTVSWPAS
jgi:hypothetical protein